MTVEYTRNGIFICAIVNGHLMQRLYQGHTKREAVEMFKQESKESI